MGNETNRSPNILIVLLGDNCTIGEVRSVRFNKERLLLVRISESGIFGDKLLQFLEGLLAFVVPFERRVFLRKVIKGSCHGGKTGDESSIII